MAPALAGLDTSSLGMLTRLQRIGEGIWCDASLAVKQSLDFRDARRIAWPENLPQFPYLVKYERELALNQSKGPTRC